MAQPTSSIRSRCLTVFCFSLGLGLSLGLYLGGFTGSVQAQPWGQMLVQGIQILQTANLSESQEVALGRRLDQQVTSQMRLSTDVGLVGWIDQIGQRLARVSERPSLPYTFRVVEDRDINAFATVGGFVYMTSAAVRVADSEDQIAAVLAHEIAHITERHALEQLQRNLQARAGAQLLGLESSNLATVAFELGINRPHSREDEFIADAKGLQILSRAGYGLNGMPQFLAKLNTGGATPVLFSTHPHIPDRIARLNQLIAQQTPTAPAYPLPQSAPRTDVQVMPLLPGVGSP